MIRALRAAAFGLAEGVRIYLGAARRTPADSDELRQLDRPLGAELIRVADRGSGA
jgi:hypothetical protein